MADDDSFTRDEIRPMLILLGFIGVVVGIGFIIRDGEILRGSLDILIGAGLIYTNKSAEATQ